MENVVDGFNAGSAIKLGAISFVILVVIVGAIILQSNGFC